MLLLEFDNGISKVVDVYPILEGPMFEELRSPDFFCQVLIDPIARTVVWPNGADLAPEALFDLDPVSDEGKASSIRQRAS